MSTPWIWFDMMTKCIEAGIGEVPRYVMPCCADDLMDGVVFDEQMTLVERTNGHEVRARSCVVVGRMALRT
jgi:hypothetical protein